MYSVKLYNIALRILGEPADTEEVIQDVFWTVYRKAKSFQGNSQFSTWLYRLTVNAALGKIRRRKNNKEVDYEEYLPKFQTDGHHVFARSSIGRITSMNSTVNMNSRNFSGKH